MKKLLLLMIVCFSFSPARLIFGQAASPIAIVIHGGAGNITSANMSSERQKLYTVKLDEAISAGYAILQKGGSSLDAVEAAINIMEDSPLFNAGKGAVFTNEGFNELDASIMDGSNLKAGAVAGIKHIKNPISLARLVMEKSQHVMLAREGAELFAKEQNVPLVDEKYFYTKERWDDLQKAKASDPEATPKKDGDKSEINKFSDSKFGTVGCVALDKNGNLAAGTSTGGMTNKKYGRVGDSPIIGAGTYANNSTCAVSSTGHGEYFIRSVVAYDISALMEYKGYSVKQAAGEVVLNKLKKLGGTGGVIALDAKGNIATPFNTQGMFRAFIDTNGNKSIEMFGK